MTRREVGEELRKRGWTRTRFGWLAPAKCRYVPASVKREPVTIRTAASFEILDYE